MKELTRQALAALCYGRAVACTSQPHPVDQVQTNLVDKAIFEGEWWYSQHGDRREVRRSRDLQLGRRVRAVRGLDVDRLRHRLQPRRPRSARLADVFVPDRAHSLGDRRALPVRVPLVRAGRRAATPTRRSPDYRGEPLAVFKIVDHVDVRKDYNTVTGEKTNVTLENTSDRLWYERQYVRVDWSENLITDFSANDAQANELFTQFEREPTPFFIQDGVERLSGLVQAAVRARGPDEKDYRFADEWPKDQRDKIHYMSFVTKEVWSPGDGCLTAGGTCASASVTMRNAFLRVPPKHEYAVATMTNREFDHFGIFRSHQVDVRARRRGRRDRAHVLHHRRAVRRERRVRHQANICVGGLTDRPRRDRLPVVLHVAPEPVLATRSPTTRASRTGSATARHLTCDGIDDKKTAMRARRRCARRTGCDCDPTARRCTLPVATRPLRVLDYRLARTSRRTSCATRSTRSRSGTKR